MTDQDMQQDDDATSITTATSIANPRRVRWSADRA